METDYPSSHSMDTVWFAVDEAGHVGVFVSGEVGHVPHGAEDGAVDLMDALEGKEDNPFEDWDKRAARLGLFYYSFNDFAASTVEPYERGLPPEQPIHVDQLPPELRQRVRTICFKNMDFSKQELIQPLEQYECDFWNEYYLVAYLGSDGKTIRPVPGKENLFADFCIDFQRENPEEAKKYRFQAPQPEMRNPRRRRKENNDGQ